MSSLIRWQEAPAVRVTAFEAEEFGEALPAPDGAHVQLPLARSSAHRGPDGSAREFPGSGEDREEDEETRLARLEREAYEKGFEQGQRDGLALEKRQTEEKERQFRDLFAGLQDLKRQICTETEAQLLRLSLMIAGRIIRKEVRTDAGVIKATVRAALEFLVDRSRLRILLNPEDAEAVRELLPELTAMTKGGEVEVVEEGALERGGCMIETGFGRINATIDEQLRALGEVMDREYEAHRGGSDAVEP